MKNAVLVKYRNLNYENYKYKIEEISGTFKILTNKKPHIPTINYSLHTEFAGSNKNINEIINALNKHSFTVLANSLKGKTIFSLWTSKEWVYEFVKFIDFLITNKFKNKKPTVIEIHPPFTTKKIYNNTLSNFIEYYKLFENKIKTKYSDDIVILMENRNGNFLLSKSQDYITLNNLIKKEQLSLKLIVDIPQLYGKMQKEYKNLSNKEIIDIIISDLCNSVNIIGGFHICGKGHRGNFNTLFGEEKEYFLNEFKKVVSAINHTIYVVPEIFSQSDFNSIMDDLHNYNIFNFLD